MKFGLSKAPAIILTVILAGILFFSSPSGFAERLLAQAEEPSAPSVETTPAEAGSPGVEETAPQEPGTVKPGRAKAERPMESASGGPVSFFFEDADIFDVMQTVFGDILKANYIIDQRVKGKVTFRTVNPIPRDEVLNIMEIVLRLNGIGFVEEKGFYRILPLTEVSNELVYAQMGKTPGKVAIELFTFKNLNVRDSLSDIENSIGLSSQVGKVRIVPIYRLNAILAVASDKTVLDYVRSWIKTFETMFADAKPKVMVYPLQNSKAEHVASMLQSILSGGGGGGSAPAPTHAPAAAPKPGTPAATSPTATMPSALSGTQAPKTGAAATVSGTGFLVSSETRIFADETTNSLVVLATPTDYAIIEEMIKKIDVVQRQVVIEGLLVRVDITDNMDFGMQWSIANNLTIKGFTKNDMNIAGPLTLTTPITDDVLNHPAMFQFTAFDAAGKVKLALQALATQGRAKILASPHILVSDNREARIQVGQQIPIATSTTTTPLTATTTDQTTGTNFVNTSTSTIQYKDIGIILKVKPQINDSGVVTLELTQEVSSQGADVNIAGQAFTSINKTEATTNLVAKDGETIIIGGLIREDTTKSRSGIPFLSRIPVLGYLFGSTKDDTTRAELIILLTPHVVRNMGEAVGVTSDYVDKYKGVAKDKSIDQFIKERRGKAKGGEKEKSDGGTGGQDTTSQEEGTAPSTREEAGKTVPPAQESRDSEVDAFIKQYISAYESGDIEKFMSLYSRSAVENNYLLYDEIRRTYQKNFQGGRNRYELSDIQVQKDGNHIKLTGAYSIGKADGSNVSRGHISWTLIKENGVLKILKSEYDRS